MTEILLTDTPTPSPSLLSLLRSHLPHSLPVLRRLQFAQKFVGGSTANTHVLLARYKNQDENGDEIRNGNGDEKVIKVNGHFAAACVDLSRAPETQVWVYSTLEDGSANATSIDTAGVGNGGGEGQWAGGEKKEEEERVGTGMELVMALLRRIRSIAATGGGGTDDGRVLVGSLHEDIRQGLLARGVKMDVPRGSEPGVAWEFCGKWLFRVEDLPVNGAEGLPEEMRWDQVRREDVRLVQSRTLIARQEATLLMLPSTAVRLRDGTLVAWALLGLDGTIISLHVEESYRRLGLAKAVACKLMREHLGDYGNDGWGAADVFVLNDKSQGFCKSIGGKLSWTISWAMVHLSSVGDPM